MAIDKEIMKKNALIAEMIIGMTPTEISDPLNEMDYFTHENETVYISHLDYQENWNSLIEACKVVSVMTIVTDRHSNDIAHNLLSFNKKGLFSSLASLAEWLKWRGNISLSRKPEVQKK